MRKIFCVVFLLLLIPAVSFAARLYDKLFVGQDGYGEVTLEVTDKINFTITVRSGQHFFCFAPESIVQSGNPYEIGPDSHYDIPIIWENFNGCGIIYEGVNATGTMSSFPSTFNVWDSFRIYCGIWEKNDYFDVEAGTPQATTSTTTSNSSTSSSTTTSNSSTSSSTTTPSSSTILSTTTSTSRSQICPASLIYGDTSKQTELLRSIRDNVLSKFQEGRELIKLYYQWSPAIVRAMGQDEDFKEEIKELVDEILEMIQVGVE